MADESSPLRGSSKLHDAAPPALVESPEAALRGRLSDATTSPPSPRGDDDDNNDDAHGHVEHMNNIMEQYVYHYPRLLQEKTWAWAKSAPILMQNMYKQLQFEIQRIGKNKTEKQRYQMGGVVLVYALIMYACTWTITLPGHLATCPAFDNDDNLAISVAWRLSGERLRPTGTCATDQILDEYLEQRDEDGVLVKLHHRPVTFLNSRRWQIMPNTQDSSDGEADETATTKQVKQALQDNGSRWVSLQYGHYRTFNPFVALWRFILRQFTRPRRVAEERMLQALEQHPYPHAFTQEPLLSDQDMDFLEAWSDQLTDDNDGKNSSSSWHGRVAKVAWGGRSKWWHPHYARSSYYPLETIDGGNLLYPYYEAMKNRQGRQQQQCIGGGTAGGTFSLAGCDTQVAILSTLEWRESYKPWMPTVDVVVSENYNGWVYARGLSKPSPYGRHGLVWLRAGQHRVQNSTSYTRSIVHSVERAIAAALRQGRVGRANIIVDAEGYEWSKIPDFTVIKQIFNIFQDHYPGRLGAIFLCNMSPAAEILFSLVKPLVDKSILEKIYILPQNATERNQELETFIEPENIPTWLGGKDRFKFDVAYYNADVSHLDALPSLQ